MDYYSAFKKKEILAACDNWDEPWVYYAKWVSQTGEYGIIYTWNLKINPLPQTPKLKLNS